MNEGPIGSRRSRHVSRPIRCVTRPSRRAMPESSGTEIQSYASFRVTRRGGVSPAQADTAVRHPAVYKSKASTTLPFGRHHGHLVWLWTSRDSQSVWICRADKAWIVIIPRARRPRLGQPGCDCALGTTLVEPGSTTGSIDPRARVNVGAFSRIGPIDPGCCGRDKGPNGQRLKV